MGMDKAQAETAFKRASKLFARGEHRQALRLLQELEMLFPGDAKVLDALRRCEEIVGTEAVQGVVLDAEKKKARPWALIAICGAAVVLLPPLLAALLSTKTRDQPDEVVTRIIKPTVGARRVESAPSQPTATPETSTAVQPYRDSDVGRIVRQQDSYGDYWQYVPSNLTSDPKMLVIAHGTIRDNESAISLARTFINRWPDFAEEYGFILIAPAFDRRNYQAYGGYRGLFGRSIGADEFVNRIVDRFAEYFPSQDGQFYLYGHSAGAQFGIRYCVRHPDRIVTAVLSAPGRFAYPDPSAAWPYGAGRLRRTIEYKNPAHQQAVDIQPDIETWVRASELPITIVVGSNDLEPQPDRPAHRGSTRVDLAFSWTEDMNRLASSRNRKANILVDVVQGVGHDSARLTSVCQYYLAEQ